MSVAYYLVLNSIHVTMYISVVSFALLLFFNVTLHCPKSVVVLTGTWQTSSSTWLQSFLQVLLVLEHLYDTLALMIADSMSVVI